MKSIELLIAINLNNPKKFLRVFNSVFLILFIVTGVSACVEIPRTIEYDKELAFTEISGYKFNTSVKGDKHLPVVIVVHGGPGGDHHYLKSLSKLSNDYRIVFYDQRGSGLSPRVNASELTLKQSLTDLHLFVEHFSAGSQVKLIGHSWGAMLVSGYVAAYPNRVSHAVMVEPGMLDADAAQAFVDIMNDAQSFSNVLALLKYMSVYPFVSETDGHEGFDYVMTKLLNNSKPGAPYQCNDEVMPEQSFIRAGFDAFNQMLKPVMDDPTVFKDDLTEQISGYSGELMMISSECSQIGYDFQEKYHIHKLPRQTIHVKAKKMGHNMLTLNSTWSVNTISHFFGH